MNAADRPSRDAASSDEPRVERLEEVQAARAALADGDATVIAEAVETLIAKIARFQDLWTEAEDRWRNGVTPWTAEINRLRDLLATDSPERMAEALKEHHQQPVWPVSYFCSVFDDWFRALRVALERDRLL